MNGEFREGWVKYCSIQGIELDKDGRLEPLRPLEVEPEPMSEVEAAIRKTNEYWADFIIGLLPRSDNSPVMELSRITQKIDSELQKLEG